MEVWSLVVVMNQDSGTGGTCGKRSTNAPMRIRWLASRRDIVEELVQGLLGVSDTFPRDGDSRCPT